MEHTPRVGGADLTTNKYYNDKYWVQGRGYVAQGTNYQCTYWAYQRAQEDCEERVLYFGDETIADIDNPLFNFKGFHDACNWYREAQWPKSVDNPQPGDIVCYGTGWGAGHGHVRIIEKIIDNYMYLSGGNENYRGGAKFNIKCPLTIGGGASATGLQGYIHNPKLTNAPQKEPDYKELYLEAKAKLDKIQEVLNG